MSTASALRSFRRAIAHWGWREYGVMLCIWAFTAIVPYVYGWGMLSFLLLPSMLAVIPALTSLVEQLTPNAPAFDSRRKHVLELYTFINGSERHGKLTHVDGNGRATWMIAGSTPQTVDVLLADATFRELWNSVRSFATLRNYKTNAPVESLDLNSNYFLGIGFTDGGDIYMGKYLIPHTCNSVKVNKWLKEFMATYRVAAQPVAPADGFAAR